MVFLVSAFRRGATAHDFDRSKLADARPYPAVENQAWVIRRAGPRCYANAPPVCSLQPIANRARIGAALRSNKRPCFSAPPMPWRP
jgi:hypothetical protein